MSEPTVVETAPIPAHVPLGRAHLIDTQSFVFWVFAVVVVYSGIHLFSSISHNQGVQAFPANNWLALVQWTLYGGVFLGVVYSHQLFVRRSAWVTVGALAWGGVAATWFASQANASLQDIFSHWFALDFNERWGVALSAATIEELLKTLGLVVLALLPLAKVRSTLDGWFYGMMIGLGFQVFEDYLYTVSQSGDLTQVFQFLIQRGFFTGLWAHAIYTGIVGVGVGYFVSRKDRSFLVRLGVAVGLFAVAWFFHFIWDAPLLNDWLGDSRGAFLATVLIKGLPALGIMLLVLRWGRNHERTVWAKFVRDHISRDLVSDADTEALLSRRSRRTAQKSAKKSGGHHAAEKQRQLQRAQLTYVQTVSEEGAQSLRAREAADLIRRVCGGTSTATA